MCLLAKKAGRTARSPEQSGRNGARPEFDRGAARANTLGGLGQDVCDMFPA